MKPRRPYLLRALHEWISDSGETPHIVVDAAAEGVTVPRQYVKDGKIVLNVSFSATQLLKLGNDFVSFEARFGGVGFAVMVPVRAILGIYARETGPRHDLPGRRCRSRSDRFAARGAHRPAADHALEASEAAGGQVAGKSGAKRAAHPFNPMRAVRRAFDGNHVETHGVRAPLAMS